MSVSSFTFKARAGLAAIALAAASLGSAHAASDALGSLGSLGSTFEVGIGSPFIDTLTFTLGTDVAASFVAAGEGFTIPGLLTLSGSPDVTFAIYSGDTALTGYGTAYTGILAAGDYAFKVKGSTGGYTITWATTTPVPEPETLALALGGLAVAGFVSSRRRQRAH